MLTLGPVRLGSRLPALSSLALASLTAACGGSAGPAPSPTPTPAPTYHAAVNIFYDQDGNGLRDSDEPGVVPNVQVEIGGQDAVSQPHTGRVEMDGVAGGADPVVLKQLPPFY
ncbi:MAG: hypothetical protein ACHQNV_06000, partial [Vicinamibacteria bacterium]